MEHIYRIIDPRDQLPFYIGITNNPNIRYVQHISDKEGAKAKRIRSIRNDGLEPIFEIIESYEGRQVALEREAYWISHYLNQGIKLVNISMNPSQTPRLKQAKKRLADDWREPHCTLWQDSFVEKGETWVCTTKAFPERGTKMLHLAAEYGRLTTKVRNNTTYYRESELKDFRAWAEKRLYPHGRKPFEY